MAECLTDVQEILGMYVPEKWEQPIPQLTDEQVVACHDYFREQDMIAVASSVAISSDQDVAWGDATDFDGGIPSIGRVLRYNLHAIAELDNHIDRFVGPYILGNGRFFEKGVAVWGLRHAAIKRRVS